MKFEEALSVVKDEPVFETGLLLAGDRDPADIRRQLSRWVGARRVRQLRRGLYTLAAPYRKVEPHPFLVANRLQPGSYVSLQSALAFHGLIPELVPVVTSVGIGRPRTWDTPLGRFEYRHVKRDLLMGFRWLEVSAGQNAFVATPEKALLDLVYLEPEADDPDYLRELRLQNSEVVDFDELKTLFQGVGSPKLSRAAAHILELLEADRSDFESL